MAQEKNLKQAKVVYKTLCEQLDDMGWHYEKDDDELRVNCTTRGDDLPIEIDAIINPEQMLIAFYSDFPFTAPKARREAMAVAVSVANYGMVDGSFDYDYKTGQILFRMTSCFYDCLIGKDLIEYMLMGTCIIVDRYNDRFFNVAKTDMSTEEIIRHIREVE